MKIDIQKFNNKFNISIEKSLNVELSLLKFIDAIYITKSEVIPTSFGQYLSVVMMKEFYMGMDEVRAQLKKNNKILGVKL